MPLGADSNHLPRVHSAFFRDHRRLLATTPPPLFLWQGLSPLRAVRFPVRWHNARHHFWLRDSPPSPMAIDPAAISASPPVMTIAVELTIPESPAARKGIVSPS